MANTQPLGSMVITCGCGLYTTDSLEDWDSHLAELVASNDGNIKLHIERTSITYVQDEEITRQQLAKVKADEQRTRYFRALIS